MTYSISIMCNATLILYYFIVILLMISCITSRTLNYGNYGIFLNMGNAGFISSTLV